MTSTKSKSKVDAPLAANVTEMESGPYSLHVRSLSPQFSNVTFAKVKGGLVQMDFGFVELDIVKKSDAPDTDVAPQNFTLKDKHVQSHTTLMLPIEVAQRLSDELNALLTESASRTSI